MGSVRKTRAGGKPRSGTGTGKKTAGKTAKKAAKKAAGKARKKAARSARKKGTAKKTASRPSGSRPSGKQGGGAGAAKTLSKMSKKRSIPAPDIEVDAEVLEFIEALDRYKKQYNRPFPSWSEVLHVLHKLGYRKP